MSTGINKKGQTAEKPRQIPFKGWKEIGKRTFSQISDDHVQIVSAGIAFYFFLALFPAIIATINIYSLVIDPSQIQEQFDTLEGFLPSKAYEIITGILEPILNKPNSTLGWSLVISILVSLWSANKGTSALFEGINIAYDEKDERGFIKKTGLTFIFTIGAIILGLVCMMLLIFYPAFVDKLGMPSSLETLIGWGRWFLIAILFIGGLGILYKNAPDRDDPEYRWVSWGAIFSTILWIAGSFLFSWYVENFGSYDKVYGSFAAVIILMLWLFLTAFIILLGAEINSEMEHQTRKDTTVGEDEPMGERGAYHADNMPGDKN
jgi:membrane protein